jgi:hypothetical protein
MFYSVVVVDIGIVGCGDMAGDVGISDSGNVPDSVDVEDAVVVVVVVDMVVVVEAGVVTVETVDTVTDGGTNKLYKPLANADPNTFMVNAISDGV